MIRPRQTCCLEGFWCHGNSGLSHTHPQRLLETLPFRRRCFDLKRQRPPLEMQPEPLTADVQRCEHTLPRSESNTLSNPCDTAEVFLDKRRSTSHDDSEPPHKIGRRPEQQAPAGLSNNRKHQRNPLPSPPPTKTFRVSAKGESKLPSTMLKQSLRIERGLPRLTPCHGSEKRDRSTTSHRTPDQQRDHEYNQPQLSQVRSLRSGYLISLRLISPRTRSSTTMAKTLAI
jgi:hypothetical protein